VEDGGGKWSDSGEPCRLRKHLGRINDFREEGDYICSWESTTIQLMRRGG